ncbi:uncharacterized protein [Argopecten irradians]|uniref:uncharacterized protein n=1 Tax=Argopecten irradians TaxID=31199 RepID=UPI0037167FB7
MLLFVFVIFCYMDKIYCGCNMGPNNVASYIASLPSSTGEQVITADTSMDAGCCGLLDRIQFYPRGTGYVQFQFWRPLAANEYTLITEYRYYVPIRDTTWTIYFPADVYLQTGDFIGWYTESTGVIAYGSGSYDRNIVVSIGDVAEGYNFSLSTPYINNRIYAIKYYISNGNKADFTNLPASIDAYDDTPVGSLLYTISYTDLDVEDVSTLVLTLRSITPSTANVAVDIATGKVTTTGPLTFGTIYVDMRVHDRCNLGNERILTINVINYSPVIGNLPASCDLSEIVTIETFLYEVTVSDASGDAVTCAINNTSPAGAPFLLKFISGTTSYGIYSQSSPSLDYSTTSLYTFVVYFSLCDIQPIVP